MKFSQLALTTIISAVISLLIYTQLNHTSTGFSTSQPAFDRVVKSRTLRCAYAIWPPVFMLDPNTKKMTGYVYDIIQQMGKILDLKIEWTEEIPYSQVADNLKSGRNDAFCMTLWPSGNRAASLDFTAPIDYIGAYAFVRASDKRFDGDLDKINDPNISIAIIEGDYTKAIADEDFPLAKQYPLSMDSDGSQLALAVTAKKADVIFSDPFMIEDFNKNNANALRQVAQANPVRVFGDVYAVNKGETKLRDMMNVALAQMNQSGFIKQKLDEYLGKHKGQYFYPAQPYQR